MNEPIRTDRVPREVIDSKLLVALDGGDKVAILASKDDLVRLMAGLSALGGASIDAHQDVEPLLQGLRELHHAAFGSLESTT